MSRSNPTTEPAPKRTPAKHVELIPDHHPRTVTVNGTGLLHWGERAKAGEVHLYRMDVKDLGKYVLHMIWLEGRTLYNHGTKPTPSDQPEHRPLRSSQKPAAIQAALKLFGRAEKQ